MPRFGNKIFLLKQKVFFVVKQRNMSNEVRKPFVVKQQNIVFVVKNNEIFLLKQKVFSL